MGQRSSPWRGRWSRSDRRGKSLLFMAPPLRRPLGDTSPTGRGSWRTRRLGLTRSLAEFVGRTRSGRGEPGDRDDGLRFGSTCPLRRSCSCVRIGPSERLSALIPKSPRTGANQDRSAIRLDPRRLAIGGFTIPRPVAPRCLASEASGGPGSIQRTDHHRPRPRDRAAPLSSIPIAASGRIQAPSPCDGDTKSMRRLRSPRTTRRKKVVGR